MSKRTFKKLNFEKINKTYLIACSLWAFLISGLTFLLARMSVSEAPTIARWYFCVRLVRFFDCSSS